MTTAPTTRPLASMVLVTPGEGRAEQCSWCSAPSVVKVVDRSWLDYACQAHAIEWYPVEYRILVPQVDMTKWTMAEATVNPLSLEIRRLKAEARSMLQANRLGWLAVEFKVRAESGISLYR